MIKFYTDTHMTKALAIQLRQAGVDVLRCEEISMASASDLAHLEYATGENRVVITHDGDFLALDKQWQAEGKAHAGIMYCLPHLQGAVGIGRILKECLDLHDLISGGAGTIEDDIANHIIYVS
jgi:hypothetical protein